MANGTELVVAPSEGDDELRLPRPPGVFRRFGIRHPLALDIVIATVCLLLSVPAAVSRSGSTGADGDTWLVPPAAYLTAFALTAISCVALVWRRRFPAAVFVLSVLPYVILQSAVALFVSPVLLVTSYTLAVLRPPRRLWAIAGSALAALVASSVIAALVMPTPQLTVGVGGASVVSILLGVLLGSNVGGRRRYEEALIGRSRQLLVEREQRGLLAAADERARIAREMHDIVSHSLTVIVALSEGAAATPDRARAQQATDAIGATARRALTEMRAMLGVLREDTGDAPLRPAQSDGVEEIIAAAQRAGFPVTLTVSGVDVAPEPVRFAVTRIVQEGLTNAMRHARAATGIRVSIQHAPTAVRVAVRNDGVMPAEGPGGYGLRGLGERIAHVGGTFRSSPGPDGTWLLAATIPIESAEEHADD